MPTEPSEPDAAATSLEGELGGDARLEGGCAWIDAQGKRYQVEYPQGYAVHLEPVRLVGPDGEVVAEAGDTLRVTGAVVDGVMTTCQVGPVFRATSVEAA